MLQTRIDKTFDKVRTGELSAPTAVRTLTERSKGTTCSGCGEVIEQLERYYCVRVRSGTLLPFHLICHEAWV